MKNAPINEKEIFACLRRHQGLKKIHTLFNTLLGDPVWWLLEKPNGHRGIVASSLEWSHQIWGDPRIRKIHFDKELLGRLKRQAKGLKPFFLTTPAGRHFCMPLIAQDRLIGFLGFYGIKETAKDSVLLDILQESLALLLENSCKTEELGRLSASIRPRAVALSTVHTVHRIINSTLNLDELISRLAHLTAQVLRVNRCSIYLVQNPEPGSKRSRPGALVCKARVGYPKTTALVRPIPMGKGVEGWVAKTAKIVLRKSFLCVPLIDDDVIGVLNVCDKKDKHEFSYFDQEILTTLAEEAVIAIKNAQLYEEQRRVTLGTIRSLAVILGSRMPNSMPPEIFLKLTLRVAEDLRIGEQEMQALHYATLLKDTARAGIPEEILKKRTKLTGEEYKLLRDHPVQGAKIVQSFESLRPVAPIILYSREKYDGTGYPEGLKSEQIPIGARILGVINAFEAIVFGRPYRDQASLEDALKEIRRNSGSQFDPKVVEVFIRVLEKDNFHKLLKSNKTGK